MTISTTSQEEDNTMTDYTAADFLGYLRYSDSLGFVSEQLDLLHEGCGDCMSADLPDLIATIDSIRHSIRAEDERHNGARSTYSNGLLITRVELYPSTEPAEDGKEIPVLGELYHTINPNGTTTLSQPGGEWADEVAGRLFTQVEV